MTTIKIDIYVSYQGQASKRFCYVVPQNQEDIDNPEYMLYVNILAIFNSFI